MLHETLDHSLYATSCPGDLSPAATCCTVFSWKLLAGSLKPLTVSINFDHDFAPVSQNARAIARLPLSPVATPPPPSLSLSFACGWGSARSTTKRLYTPRAMFMATCPPEGEEDIGNGHSGSSRVRQRWQTKQRNGRGHSLLRNRGG